MRTLTKIAATAALATATLGGATAASAHPGDAYRYGQGSGYDRGYGRDYGWDYRNRNDRPMQARAQALRAQLDDLTARVERNDRYDRISEREADGLRRDLRAARRQLDQFSFRGHDPRDLRAVEWRVDNIRGRLHDEQWDRNGHRG